MLYRDAQVSCRQQIEELKHLARQHAVSASDQHTAQRGAAMSDVGDDPADRAALLDNAPHLAGEQPEQHTLREHAAAEATALPAADDDEVLDPAAKPAQRQVNAGVHVSGGDDDEDDDPAVRVSLLGDGSDSDYQDPEDPDTQGLPGDGDSAAGRAAAPAITAVAVRAPIAQQPDAIAAGAAAASDAPHAAEPHLPPHQDGSPAVEAQEQQAAASQTDPVGTDGPPQSDAEGDPEARTALLAGSTDPAADPGIAEPEVEGSTSVASEAARRGVAEGARTDEALTALVDAAAATTAACGATVGTPSPSAEADPPTAERVSAEARDSDHQLMPPAAASPAEEASDVAEASAVAEDAGADGGAPMALGAAAAAAAVTTAATGVAVVSLEDPSAEAEPSATDHLLAEARDGDQLPMPPAAAGPAGEAPDAAPHADGGRSEAVKHEPPEQPSQQPVTTADGPAEAELDAGTSHDAVVGERSSQGLISHPLQLANESASAAATEQADAADARAAAGATTPLSAGDEGVAAESEPQTPGTPAPAAKRANAADVAEALDVSTPSVEHRGAAAESEPQTPGTPDAATPTTPTAASAAATASPAPALPSKPTPQPATLAHAASAPVPAVVEAPGLMHPVKALAAVHPDVYFATTRAALVSQSNNQVS